MREQEADVLAAPLFNPLIDRIGADVSLSRRHRSRMPERRIVRIEAAINRSVS